LRKLGWYSAHLSNRDVNGSTGGCRFGFDARTVAVRKDEQPSFRAGILDNQAHELFDKSRQVYLAR
jgi:hypothetical protein